MIPTFRQLLAAPAWGRAWVRGIAASAAISLLVVSCGSGSDQPGASGPGIHYHHERVSKVPWSIHVVKIERGRRDLELRTTLGRGASIGLGTLVDQVTGVPANAGIPLAALNGDFYEVNERNPYHGDPRGLQIFDGELVSAATDQASFWIDAAGVPQATNVLSKLAVLWPDGSRTAIGLNEERERSAAVLYTPRLGASTKTKGGREFVLERAGDGPWLPLQTGVECTARVREARNTGNTPLGPDVMVLSFGPEFVANQNAPAGVRLESGAALRISTATIPDLKGVKMAISGGYVLVRDGVMQDLKVPRSGEYKYRTVNERHPRSAIGASRDHIYFCEVDGRLPGFSMGMTLAELGEHMRKLGCELVLSLDGGASATFWLKGKVMNKPCNGDVRPIANGVVVVKKSAAAKR